MSIAVPAWRGFSAAFALPVVLTGCSVNSPPRIYSSLHNASIPASVRIESPSTTAAQRFTAALLRNLASRGIHIQAKADTLITVALAERPATMGIAQESPDRAEVRWLWSPRRKHGFDSCNAKTMEVNVVAKSDRVAQPIYTGRSAFTYCRLKPENLDTLASAFSAAMSGQ